MSDIQELRTDLAEELVADTRALSDAQEIDRDSLDNIRCQLQALAAKRELWS